MTPTKVLLVIVVFTMIDIVYTSSEESPPLGEIRFLRLHKSEESYPMYKLDLMTRMELCRKKAWIVAKYLGFTFELPSTNKYFVPAAQKYSSNKFTKPLAGVRCPTFPPLYIFDTENKRHEEKRYLLKMLNPYSDSVFEYESALSIEEIELSKKDKKDKKEEGQKKPKDEVGISEKENQGNDKKNSSIEKGEEEEGKQGEKKQSMKENKIEVEDEEKQKSIKELSPLEYHLLQKMIGIGAEQRWHLCNKVRQLILYEVKDFIYVGSDDPKIYKFSHYAGPPEIDVAFQCFSNPKIYIRVSRSNTPKVFLITLFEPNVLVLKYLPKYL